MFFWIPNECSPGFSCFLKMIHHLSKSFKHVHQAQPNRMRNMVFGDVAGPGMLFGPFFLWPEPSSTKWLRIQGSEDPFQKVKLRKFSKLNQINVNVIFSLKALKKSVRRKHVFTTLYYYVWWFLPLLPVIFTLMLLLIPSLKLTAK